MRIRTRPANKPRFAIALDKLGMIVVAIVLSGLFLQPFSLFRASRIVTARGIMIWTAMPLWQALMLMAALIAASILLLLHLPVNLRLGVSVAAMTVLALAVGRSGYYLMPADNPYARISPGGGFWIIGFAFAIAMADAVVRKQLSPLKRIGLLIIGACAIGLLLYSGAWHQLSILKEYGKHSAVFWREGRAHILLAFGSLAAATMIGIPIGILCFRVPLVRATILGSLNVLQTIPSIALFGLLIAPLAWVGRNVPGAAALGIAGIGFAPAIVALFAYSLLPVISNTVVGLDSVSRDTRDAARGMGMTGGQRLTQVEFPLAFPIILTGIRIVLVQNIGLTVIAALIGAGGYGTFVFQGITQMATDLVLLGVIPVVGLAFAAAIILDALVEISRTGNKKGDGHDRD